MYKNYLLFTNPSHFHSFVFAFQRSISFINISGPINFTDKLFQENNTDALALINIVAYSEKNAELILCSFWNFLLALVRVYLLVFKLFYLCLFFFVRFFNYLTFVRFFQLSYLCSFFVCFLRLSISNCFSSYMCFLFQP